MSRRRRDERVSLPTERSYLEGEDLALVSYSNSIRNSNNYQGDYSRSDGYGPHPHRGTWYSNESRWNWSSESREPEED
jgi:hypothetical protein